jgi:hypothetical protein
MINHIRKLKIKALIIIKMMKINILIEEVI